MSSPMRRLTSPSSARASLSVALVLASALAFAAEPLERVKAVRVWPAPEYTRVTLESAEPLQHHMISIKKPERLVLDLEGVDFASVQEGFAGKLSPGDAYIGNLRVGRFKPGVVRVVLELKTEVKPQIFTLAPIGEYGHRLVLDIYPTEPVDPIMALLQKSELKMEQSLGQSPEEALGERKPETAPKPPRSAKDPSAPAGSRLVTIAVDAGHGGEDPGAKGRRGTYEKTVTMTIARKLRTQIDADPNMRALLIRDGDYFIDLKARVEKATVVNADLLVSIHADSFVKPHARGSSVFALSESGATSAAARQLAERENDADLIGGVNRRRRVDRYVEMTVTDLKLTAQITDSLKLARAVLGELGDVNSLHRGRVEQAAFAVLKAPQIPSILVETAFISNPEEEKKLNDEAYQEKIARAILRGIKSYLAKNPPLRARPTISAGSGEVRSSPFRDGT